MTCWVCFCCFYVYGFRTGHFVLDSKLYFVCACGVFDSPMGFISVAHRDTNEELVTQPYLSMLLKNPYPS